MDRGIRRSLECGKAQQLGEQDLGSVVVQFARNSPSLIFLCSNYLRGKRAEFSAVTRELIERCVECLCEVSNLRVHERCRRSADRHVSFTHRERGLFQSSKGLEGGPKNQIV